MNLSPLPPTGAILRLLALTIVGIIIIFLIRSILILVPAAVIAFTVWLITGSSWLAGVAFLVTAALSILRKL